MHSLIQQLRGVVELEIAFDYSKSDFQLRSGLKKTMRHNEFAIIFRRTLA